MKLSVSEILAFQSCPSKWFMQYVMGRQKRDRSELALNVGTYGHLRQQDFYGNPEPEALDKLLTANRSDEKWLSEIDKIDYMLEWFHRPDVQERFFPIAKVLEVEHEGTIDVGHHQVRTKTDLVGLDDKDQLWHVQWKFLSERTDVPTYSCVQERSMHEATYRDDLVSRYPDYTYMGTYLFIFLKKSIHQRLAKASCGCDPPKAGYVHRSPEEFLVKPEPLLIDQKALDRAKRNILYWANQMELTKEKALPYIAQAENSCMGKWGACHYNAVCNGEVEIENNLMFENSDPYGHYTNG